MGNARSHSYFIGAPGRRVATAPMAELTIPAKLEDALALEDGRQGHPLSSALEFDQREIPNLYSLTADREFRFSFTEHGVAYGETEASERQAAVSFKLSDGIPGFALHFDPTPVTKWGLNFAGSVCVKHSEGRERVIYLPGTRTYDPAGLTGDPHASERIGPSCSRSQASISLGELIAALKGAELENINDIQEQVRPLIDRYHGRGCLFEWMKLQIDETVYQKRDVTPYPEFIKEQIRAGKLELTEAREHTRAYLKSYNEGRPHPPLQYYRKVAAKDKVEEILSPADYETFKKIVQS